MTVASHNSIEDVLDGPVAWMNGRFIAAQTAALPVSDLGVQGLAVTEMVRTYDRNLFRLGDHLARLERSVAAIGVDQSLVGLQDISQQLARRNGSYVRSSSDLGLVLFVTAGGNPTYLGDEPHGPTMCVHSFELPLHRWSTIMSDGVRLRVSEVRQIPDDCVPASIKSRSRLHWRLASNEVARRDKGAQAVLLDSAGRVTETPTGNLFGVFGESVVTPAENVLAGVSRQVVRELCPVLGLQYVERAIQPSDLRSADEAFVSSTPTGLLPVTQFEGEAVGNGLPGPVFFELCNAWSELVGIDIIEQITSATANS